MNIKALTGTAMLLAIALVAQSLRLLFPFIPPQVSMFVIGSVVSATYVLATWRFGVKYGLLLAWITPIVAYLQGMLPIAPLILITGLGTSVYVVLVYVLRHKLLWLLVGVSALCRMVILYVGALLLLQFLHITGPKTVPILMAFSWPQLVTSTLGIGMAMVVMKRYTN